MRMLAQGCLARRRLVAVAWLATLLALTGLHSLTGSAYNDDLRLGGTDSFRAVALLQQAAPRASGDTEQVVIAVSHGRVTDPAVRRRVQGMLAAVARLPHVTEISSPYARAGARQIAPSGRVAFAGVTFDVRADAVDSAASNRFVNTARSAAAPGLDIEVEGQIARAGANPGSAGLAIGFLAAGIVLFLVFGSLAAMALPLLTAGLSLGTAVAVIGLLSNAVTMASFSEQLSLLIGLGVGVDYALFIVTRHRQGLLRGLTAEEAVLEAVDTSGRAVLFAGIIVCVALLGMIALGVSFLYGVAIAASIAVAFTVVAALTLLPALLGFLGPRVLRRSERRALAAGELRDSDESAGWARWARAMQRRPALWAAAAAALMVALVLPSLHMRLGSADSGSDPAGTTTRKAYDLLAQGFGPGYNGPLPLVSEIRGAGQRAAFVRVERAVAATPGVLSAAPPVFLPGRAPGQPGIALADVYPVGSPQAASTAALLHRVRGAVIPAATRGTGLHVLVGGQTAIFDDFATVLAAKLPQFLAVVILVSFLLLVAVFRSLLVPLVAAVMNLLSAAAAFGVVTAIFQDGFGAALIGVDKTGPIESFLPVMLFAILFGLSMDYEVFLVTRIHEEWHRRGDNREAVAHGLAATGRTITAAGAIMILVFAAFILGGQRIIDLFGVGLASAVFLDAMVVRSVLVPALMLWLGRANWALPRWLARLIPHLRVEGSALAGRSAAGAGLLVVPEPAS